jgi:hypothetical protein
MPPRNRPYSIRRFPEPTLPNSGQISSSSEGIRDPQKLRNSRNLLKNRQPGPHGATPTPTRPKLQTRKMAGPDYSNPMIAIAETLDKHAEGWKPEVTSRVEELVGEIIELADADALDILPSRAVQQEVLDVIDDA